MAKMDRQEMIDIISDEITMSTDHTLKAILDILAIEYDERPRYYD